jgi:hypothetical protein
MESGAAYDDTPRNIIITHRSTGYQVLHKHYCLQYASRLNICEPEINDKNATIHYDYGVPSLKPLHRMCLTRTVRCFVAAAVLPADDFRSCLYAEDHPQTSPLLLPGRAAP